jgi:membrane protein DedA with SNARE-associated domain
MTLETIIQTYGYPVLVIGTFLEGETIVVLAGFLAHRGYLSLPWVIACAFVGSLAGDQLFFFMGRLKGRGFIEKRPVWQLQAERIFKLLERYKTLLIIGFRFMYGMRTATPFAIGMSTVRTSRFIVFNVIGALLWATGIGVAGYLFGKAFEAVLGNIKHIEKEIILGIIVVGAIIWIISIYRRKT